MSAQLILIKSKQLQEELGDNELLNDIVKECEKILKKEEKQVCTYVFKTGNKQCTNFTQNGKKKCQRCIGLSHRRAAAKK